LSAFFRRFSNGAPLLGLLIVFAVDRLTYSFFGDITLSPLLCNITLATFAFFLRPRQIFFWGAVYTIAAFFLLTIWRHSFVMGPITPDLVDPVYPLSRAIIRSATVFLVALLCCLLAQQRTRIQRALDESVAVVSALPVGVLISDQSGFISFANERARFLLASPDNSLMGLSIFSLFSNLEGNLIDKYSSLSEVSGQTLGPIPLQIRRNPRLTFSASMFSLQSQSEKLVATLLSENTFSTTANSYL